MYVRRLFFSILAWANVVLALMLGLFCLASVRWAFLAHDVGTCTRFYGGSLSYGCYMNFQLPTLKQHYRIERRNPADWYGGLCHEVTARVPVWPIPLASAAAAMICFAKRRSRPGSCPTCGYPTVGLGTGPCPECGAARTIG